jgi:hypothetical protein
VFKLIDLRHYRSGHINCVQTYNHSQPITSVALHPNQVRFQKKQILKFIHGSPSSDKNPGKNFSFFFVCGKLNSCRPFCPIQVSPFQGRLFYWRRGWQSVQMGHEKQSTKTNCNIQINDAYIISRCILEDILLPKFPESKVNTAIRSIAINQDGTLLTAVNNEGSCWIWTLGGGFADQDTSILALGGMHQPHTRYALKCLFSPDSTYVQRIKNAGQFLLLLNGF